MKEHLIKSQAKTLYEIVHFVNTHDGRFPNISELALILRITYGAARGRLKRLVKSGYVKQYGQGKWRLDSNLCTEKCSALFLLNAEALGKGDMIELNSLHLCLLDKGTAGSNNKKQIEALVSQAIATGYMSRIVSDPKHIRLSQFIPNQLQYLKMLVHDFNSVEKTI